MRAIILAAGLGTRLRPMTDNTPKALIKVNDKPLVEYQIEYLKEKCLRLDIDLRHFLFSMMYQ